MHWERKQRWRWMWREWESLHEDREMTFLGVNVEMWLEDRTASTKMILHVHMISAGLWQRAASTESFMSCLFAELLNMREILKYMYKIRAGVFLHLHQFLMTRHQCNLPPTSVISVISEYLPIWQPLFFPAEVLDLEINSSSPVVMREHRPGDCKILLMIHFYFER